MAEEQTNSQEQPQETEAPKRVLTYARILPGETIHDVAKRFNTTVEQILADNQINPDYIQPNQWVFV